MRYLFHLIILLSVAGCTHIPTAQIQSPPRKNMSAVVFDIDGTLTPDVLSFNKARQDASKAVRFFSDKGYKIIYVTTRIPLLQSGLPKWLQKNGFPEGSLHIAQSGEKRRHPEIFKAGIMKDYIKHGWRLEYAYGDSSTDFAAYADAGIPKERVFALRRRGSKNCEKGIYHECLNGWTEYLQYIDKEIISGK